jgi:hypothetical protein
VQWLLDWPWYFNNLTFYAFIFCILRPCRWPHDWLKNVGGYCVYNYFYNTHVHCVGTIIVYTISLYGSVTWIRRTGIHVHQKHFHAEVNFSHIHTIFSIMFRKCFAEINACITVYGYRFAWVWQDPTIKASIAIYLTQTRDGLIEWL